jgi:hypothetical protein
MDYNNMTPEQLREALVAKDQALVAKDQALVAKDQALAAKDQALAAKDQALAAKDDQIDSLVASSIAILISHDKWVQEDLHAGTLTPSQYKHSLEARKALVAALQRVFNGLSLTVDDAIAAVTIDPQATPWRCQRKSCNHEAHAQRQGLDDAPARLDTPRTHHLAPQRHPVVHSLDILHALVACRRQGLISDAVAGLTQ